MLRFIRIVAVFGMIFACLCYVWDVFDHWKVLHGICRGKPFSSYDHELKELLGDTSTRNIGFCLAGIAYCLAGALAGRQRRRKLAEARKAAGRTRPIRGHVVALTSGAPARALPRFGAHRSE
jgi:hypothetical protein